MREPKRRVYDVEFHKCDERSLTSDWFISFKIKRGTRGWTTMGTLGTFVSEQEARDALISMAKKASKEPS